MKKVLEVIQALPTQYPGLNALHPWIVYLMGCMRFEQFCCTWRALEDPEQFCPFCSAELTRRNRLPLVQKDDWILLENEFPRPDARMLLIVPTRHLTSPRLTGSDTLNVWLLFQRSIEQGLVGGALLMRFGDPRDHAGTIEHLHFNVIQPVREGGCSFPIAKKISGPYGHIEDYIRFHGFAKKVEAQGGVDWLFSDEGILQTQPKIIEQ